MINPNLTVIQHLVRTKRLGPVAAAFVCNRWGISHKTLVGNLTEEKLELIEKHPNEDPIQRQHANIARLVTIACHRGLRLKLGMPSRGQRTRSNAKTAKKINSKRNINKS